MNEQTERLKNFFADAVGMDAAGRERLIADIRVKDPAVAAELLSLLGAHDRAGDFLAPLYPSQSDALPDPRTGTSAGPYRIARLIARGGMGELYQGVRDDGAFDRVVAIKLMRYGMSPAELQRRFALERMTLARFEHPNIARLLDAGTLPDGIPYLVIEYIDGERIDEFCDHGRLTIAGRLHLFLKVCDAVQYAHQNLVVHRDLKPGNILVTSDGVPKLLDFGIAKLLGTDASPGEDDATRTGPAPLTPEYASPEQLRGERVTTSSDVYSLGVLLYKLCTGQKPHDVRGSLPRELSAAMLATDPVRPAARDLLISSADGPDRIRQILSGDLGLIILTALRKEPELRYRSVEQFADDLRRYLDGMPVSARDNTFAYRASRFIRRNAIGVTAAALLFLILVGGLTATIYQARRAEEEKLTTEHINTFLRQILNYTNPRKHLPSDTGHETTMKEMLDDAARHIAAQGGSIKPEIRAELERTLSESYGGLGRYDLMYQHLRIYITLQEGMYGKNDPRSLDALGLWAADLFAQGKMSEAETEFRDLIPRMRTAFQEGNIRAEVLTTALNNFGYLRRTQGDSHEAETAFREVLSLTPAFSPESRFMPGLTKCTLASTLADQGKFDEALRTSRDAVAEYARSGDTTLPDFGFMMTVLGGFLTETGAYDSAGVLLRRAESIFRRSVGPTHLWFGDNIRNQAALFYAEGNYPRALTAADEAIGIYLSSFGPHYDHYPTALMIRGLALNACGRQHEADTLLRMALRLRTESLPKGHPFTSIAQGALGECLASEGKYEEAESLLLTSYRDLTASQGKENPRTLRAAGRLRALYLRWNKPSEALRYGG